MLYVDIHWVVKMRRAEIGIAIVWMVGFLAVFGALAALTIDILRVHAMLRQAQSVADAAALAGARVLGGDVESFGQSKRFTIEALKRQQLSGLGVADLGELEFSSEGLQDPFEAALGGIEPNPYLTNQAVLGPIRFIVERGAYWADGESLEFNSLEGVGGDTGQYLATVNRPVVYRGVPHSSIPVRYDVPVHLIANAVRVTAELTGVRAFFGNFVGLSTFGSMSRTAVAVSDASVSAPVVPLAIPACALLLETSGDLGTGDYQFDTADFVPGKQCIRELTFTEADPLGPRPAGEVWAPFDERAEGIVRAASYDHRKTRRALPLSGVLGMPESLRPPSNGITRDDPIAGNEFARLLGEIANNGGVRAKLGEYFIPLENSIFAGGFLSSQENAAKATEAFEKLISRGSPLQQVMSIESGEDAIDNFPRLRPESAARNYFIDVNSNIRLRMKEFPPAAPGLPAFTNPMCTHRGYGNVPPAQRKALPVNIMVISPTARGSNGVENEMYCDYASVFQGADQSSFPPFASTRPRVVGFVRANLFDFRFERYANSNSCGSEGGTCENPASPNPEGVIMRGIYTPFLEATGEFVVEHRNWRECRQRALRCSFPNPPPDCPINCSGEPNPPTPPSGGHWDAMKDCFDMPAFAAIQNCAQRPPQPDYNTCLLLIGTGLNLDGYPPRPEVIREGKACMSLYNPNCEFPFGDPRCIRPPSAIEPQYGCGGVRARLDCGTVDNGVPLPQRLISPDPATVRRPMLIQ